MRPALQTTYTDIRSLVKDLKDILAVTPDVEIVELTGQYVEGLTVRLARKPRAIELINCVSTRTPGTVTGFGSAVEFTWATSGARILSIGGLAPGSTAYTFTFRVTY